MQHPFFAGKTYRLRSVNLLFVMTKPIGWKTMNRVYITKLTISLWKNKKPSSEAFQQLPKTVYTLL